MNCKLLLKSVEHNYETSHMKMMLVNTENCDEINLYFLLFHDDVLQDWKGISVPYRISWLMRGLISILLTFSCISPITEPKGTILESFNFV
jgi:hypothetical protein